MMYCFCSVTVSSNNEGQHISRNQFCFCSSAPTYQYPLSQILVALQKFLTVVLGWSTEGVMLICRNWKKALGAAHVVGSSAPARWQSTRVAAKHSTYKGVLKRLNHRIGCHKSLACCVKHSPFRLWKNDWIERSLRVTLISGPCEPKVVNPVCSLCFPSLSFKFLSPLISTSYYHNNGSLKHVSYMKKMHLDEVNLFWLSVSSFVWCNL
jgi:hypothetical protein